MNLKTYHLLISGRVQGVGYRNFVLQLAHRQGALGWVRNLTDGRVEVLLNCKTSEFTKLLLILHEGPTSALVSGIQQQELSNVLTLPAFHIQATSSRPWETTLNG
ncbi:MAG: acylphosphatase [Bdellovibrionales bacterium]|nr:acylphosphatase [Bdellovibrionales bacterium]